MIRLQKNFFKKIDPYETVANPTESTQNLSPGRFWHAEVESDVKNLRFRHPDLEIKEKPPLKNLFFNPFAGLHDLQVPRDHVPPLWPLNLLSDICSQDPPASLPVAS